MLNLLVSKPCFMAGVDFSDYEKDIEEAQKAGHTCAVVQYLHGILESKMGYDIALCLNAEECCDFELGLFKEGTYEVEVKNYPNKCKAFFWNVNDEPRGFIVDPEDLNALEYAQQCYTTKEEDL